MNSYFWIETTGKLNLLLIAFVIGLYIARRLNKYIRIENDSLKKNFKKGIQYLSRYHKLAASILIVIGAIHGWLALGGAIRLSTGMLLWVSIVTNLVIYGVRRSIKALSWLRIHRIIGGIIIVMLLLHLSNPYLFL